MIMFRLRVLIAAVVVALCAGLALAWFIRPAAAPGGTARRPVPTHSSSGQPAGSQRTPHVSLAGLRWYDFYGVELPFSPVAGPHATHGGVATGFAHTPLGALLAAVNIAIRANAQWGPRIFTPVIRGQVTGLDAGALLASCQTAYAQASRSAGVAAGQPLGAVDVTEEAFRWVSYTPAAAAIDLVSAGPDGQGSTVRASTQIGVVWDGRDWKVIAPPGGDWGNAATELSSLTGYTLFPAPGGGR
jgi:hypothetical protein